VYGRVGGKRAADSEPSTLKTPSEMETHHLSHTHHQVNGKFGIIQSNQL
jgi:hypothetical protein